MILWHIEEENGVEYEIEVGPVTIFKGSDPIWYSVVRYIEDFFTNKNSTISIYEDTQPIHKKDWDCLFIPFDAHLQMEKLNAKSPLKSILDNVCQELTLSPSYMALTDVWEEIKEEIQFLNTKINQYGVGLGLQPFEVDELKKYLSFYPLQQSMTPIEYKKILIKLFGDQVVEKKKLIILELPELYATEEQLNDLLEIVEALSRKGFWFIIVTHRDIKGNVNFSVGGRIINGASVEKIKRIVSVEAPFFVEEDIFQEAKRVFLQIVDNPEYHRGKYMLSTGDNEMTAVVIYMLLRRSGLELNIDMSMFPENLVKFVEAYS